ncbi:MAG: hypothetical protein J0L84_05460, partial [Verrucomicrobia bacterium]|nr:hypothetical protein [Verrucomicrobiota bacterium]
MSSDPNPAHSILSRRDRGWCRLAVAAWLGVWTGVCRSEVPVHDSPEWALPLDGPAGVLEVDLRGATLDPADPAGGWEVRRTVWYQWTAPAPGTLLVSVADSPNLTPFAAAFRQGDPGGFGPGQPVDFRLEAAVPVSEGERWHLAVGDRWGPDEPVVLRHRFVPLPANDAWSAAAPVPADESEGVGTLWGATLDSREHEVTGGTTARVWHVWQALSDGWATVELRSLRPGDSAFLPPVFRGRPESLARNAPPVDSLEAIPVEAGDWLSILPGGAPNAYALRVLWTSARLDVMPSGPLDAGQPAVARVTVSGAEGDVREVEFLVNGSVQFTDAVAPYEWELGGWDSGVHALAARVIRRLGDTRAVPAQPLEIRPANDRLESAAVLEGESAIAPVWLQGATAEPGEPGHLGFPARRTVWWRWTAPRDGGVRLTLERPDQSWPGALMAIYRGGAPDPLRVVGGTESGILVVPVQAGETLSLVVGCGPQCDDAPRTLHLEMFPAAVNDDFADAAALTGESQTIRAYAGMATLEPEEWAVPPESRQSLWWHWTPSGPGVLDMTTGPATYLDLFAGDTLASLEPLASLPSNSGRLPVAAGRRIFIRARPAGAADEVEFSLQFTPLPPEDAFAGALPLGSLPVQVRGVLGLATGEPGEPNPRGFGLPRSLWYRWTASADGPVFLGIGSESEGGHPDVMVFSGDRVDQLTLLATPGYGFEASAGITYSIGVFSRSFWETPDPFEFLLLPPPENDRPAQAPLLVETGDRVRGHTALATLLGTVWYRWRPAFAGTATLVHRGSAVSEVRVFAGETPGGDGAVALDRMNLAPGEAVYQFPTDAGQLLWFAVGTADQYPSDGGVFELTVAPSDIGVTGVVPEIVEGMPVDLVVQSRSASGLSVRIWSSTLATNVPALDPAMGRFRLEGLEPGDYRVAGFGTNAAGLLLASPFLPLHVAPTNDAFASAAPLSQLPVVLNGSTTGATLEPGEPLLDAQGDGGSRWWTWRAPADGAVRLTEMVGVGLFEGGSLSGLTPVLLEPGGAGSQVAQVHGGALYHLLGVPSVFASPGWWGNVSPLFSVRIAWIPSNDRFEDRIRVTGGVLDLVAEHAGAETEWGNPVEAAATPSSVWYSWTAPGDGWLTLEETFGSFSRSARVYLAGEGDRLRLMASTRSGDPSLRMPVSGGMSHELVFGDFSSSWESGQAVWSLRWHPAATNDAFAGRSLLVGDPVLVEGFSVGTTREAGEEERRHAWTGELIERTQWFSWV